MKLPTYTEFYFSGKLQDKLAQSTIQELKHPKKTKTIKKCRLFHASIVNNTLTIHTFIRDNLDALLKENGIVLSGNRKNKQYLLQKILQAEIRHDKKESVFLMLLYKLKDSLFEDIRQYLALIRPFLKEGRGFITTESIPNAKRLTLEYDALIKDYFWNTDIQEIINSK